MAPVTSSTLPTWASMAFADPVSAKVALESHSKSMQVISEADLHVGELIGKGRFKRVYTGVFGRQDVVVMRYAASQDKEDAASAELSILRHLPGSKSASFVPKVFGMFMERGQSTLVQERAPWGSLKSVLASDQAAPFLTPAVMLRVTAQVAWAVDFLAASRVVHADLACRNILVCRLTEDSEEALVKVTDLGLAKILADDVDCIYSRQPQATRWCAPETVAWSRLSLCSDVWSLGATLWELHSRGCTPWMRLEKRVDVSVHLKRLAATGDAAAARPREELSADFPQPDGCPGDIYAMIMECLQAAEQKRPSPADVAEAAASLLSEAAAGCSRVGSKEGGSSRQGRGRWTPSTSAGGSSPSTPLTATPNHGPTEALIPDCVTALTIEDFLESDRAIEALGSEAATALRMELEAKRSEDLFLADIALRRETARRKAASRASSKETLAPPKPVQPSRSPAWVLWSYDRGMIEQRLAWSEHAAWRAYDDCVSKESPCSLRGPNGLELAAHRWVALPARLLLTSRDLDALAA